MSIIHDLEFATWMIMAGSIFATMAVSQATDIMPQFSSRDSCIKRSLFFGFLSLVCASLFINVFARIL